MNYLYEVKKKLIQ